MTREQQTIVQTILAYRQVGNCDAGEWQMAADSLNAKSVEWRNSDLVSMREAIEALGQSADKVLTVFESSAVGRHGITKLATTGLDFAHPITMQLLDQMLAAGGITQQEHDTLIALSRRMISPAENMGLPPLTADDIRMAWQTYRLEQRAENLKARIIETVDPAADSATQEQQVVQAWRDVAVIAQAPAGEPV